MNFKTLALLLLPALLTCPGRAAPPQARQTVRLPAHSVQGQLVLVVPAGWQIAKQDDRSVILNYVADQAHYGTIMVNVPPSPTAAPEKGSRLVTQGNLQLYWRSSPISRKRGIQEVLDSVFVVAPQKNKFYSLMMCGGPDLTPMRAGFQAVVASYRFDPGNKSAH